MTEPILKLRQALSSKYVPINNGTLLMRTDTGRLELDLGDTRFPISDIATVTSLPLAPVNGRLYFYAGDLYIRYDNAWKQLNASTEHLHTLLGIDPDEGSETAYLTEKGTFKQVPPGLTEDEVIALILALS